MAVNFTNDLFYVRMPDYFSLAHSGTPCIIHFESRRSQFTQTDTATPSAASDARFHFIAPEPAVSKGKQEGKPQKRFRMPKLIGGFPASFVDHSRSFIDCISSAYYLFRDDVRPAIVVARLKPRKSSAALLGL